MPSLVFIRVYARENLGCERRIVSNPPLNPIFQNGVENAVCFTLGDDETRYIAAVLITERDIDLLTVRQRLEKKLPPYMLPKRIQCLASPPTNRSGKVDRVALKEGFPG